MSPEIPCQCLCKLGAQLPQSTFPNGHDSEDITPRPRIRWLSCRAHSPDKHLSPAPLGTGEAKSIFSVPKWEGKNAALCATVGFLTALTGHHLPRWVWIWMWSITSVATLISSTHGTRKAGGLKWKKKKVLGRKSQYPYLCRHKQVLQVQPWNIGKDLKDQWGDAWRTWWFCTERQESFRNYLPSSPCPGSI